MYEASIESIMVSPFTSAAAFCSSVVNVEGWLVEIAAYSVSANDASIASITLSPFISPRTTPGINVLASTNLKPFSLA